MYSISSVQVWTQAKRWTAQQRRLIVATINRCPDLFQPVAVGNTRKAVNSYTVVFKTLAAAEQFSREWTWGFVSSAERVMVA